MITAEIGQDVNKAAALLRAGSLVGIPTETVYGLAGNALRADAVAEIFRVKNRPQFDPLIVHVPAVGAVAQFTYGIPDEARELAARFWPGPLTLLLKKRDIIPDLVTAGLDTVGIRCPDHPLTLALLAMLDFPLAAPSANPFGYISPTHPVHVFEQLGRLIPYILDGGACTLGVESTVVGFEGGKTVVYRLGALALEELTAAVGPVEVAATSSSNPRSPGQLITHYAPRKKLLLGNLEELLAHHDPLQCAVLSFRRDWRVPYQFVLSPSGDVNDAAKNLFHGLRTLDKLPVAVILAEPVPDTGLGRAINDRLRRASA